MDLDKQTVELTCPNCGYKFKQTIGGLKADPTIDCAGCKTPIKIKAQGLRDGLKGVDTALADLQKTLKGFGNR